MPRHQSFLHGVGFKSLDAFGRPRARMQITNLRTNETMEAEFNPTELQEQLAVNYSEPAILGLSHAPSQYTSTGNHSFDLELLFALSEDSDLTLDDLDACRLQLLAACYPTGGAGSIRGGAPDRLFFYWPDVVGLTCTLRGLSTTFQTFNLDGRPVRWTTKVKLVEIRDARITADEVRFQGTQRAPGRPASEAGPATAGSGHTNTIPEVTIVGQPLNTIPEVTIVGQVEAPTGNATVTIPEVTLIAKKFVPRKGPKPAPPVYTLPQTVIAADSAGQGLAPGSITTLSETVIGSG